MQILAQMWSQQLSNQCILQVTTRPLGLTASTRCISPLTVATVIGLASLLKYFKSAFGIVCPFAAHFILFSLHALEKETLSSKRSLPIYWTDQFSRRKNTSGQSRTAGRGDSEVWLTVADGLRVSEHRSQHQNYP